MDPFFVIIRARDRFFGSGLNRRVSRGRKKSGLLTIDNELDVSNLACDDLITLQVQVDKKNLIEFLLFSIHYLYNYYMVCALLFM